MQKYLRDLQNDCFWAFFYCVLGGLSNFNEWANSGQQNSGIGLRRGEFYGGKEGVIAVTEKSCIFVGE